MLQLAQLEYLDSPNNLAVNGLPGLCTGGVRRGGVPLSDPPVSNREISLTGILTDPDKELIVKALFRSSRSSGGQ